MAKEGRDIRELTEKEKKTLYGLVKHPNYNDRELAEEIKLKLSTVTAIRRRLRNSDHYFTIRFPVLQHMGCEIMAIAYGNLNRMISRSEKNSAMNELAKQWGSTFLICSSDDTAILMSMEKNYTEIKRNVMEQQRFLSSANLLSDDSWHYALFPFEVSKVLNLFDYSSIISRPLKMKKEESQKIPLDFEVTSQFNLTSKEKKVLAGLVENPETPDNAIAKKVGVSRQALSNMRKKFESEKLTVELNIPNLGLLGQEILVLSHVRFNPKCMMEDRRKGINYLLEETPQFFTITGSYEAVILHSVKNYEEYNYFKNKLLSIYTSRDFIRGEPVIKLLPISDMVYHKQFDFGDVVRNILQE